MLNKPKSLQVHKFVAGWCLQTWEGPAHLGKGTGLFLWGAPTGQMISMFMRVKAARRLRSPGEAQ